MDLDKLKGLNWSDQEGNHGYSIAATVWQDGFTLDGNYFPTTTQINNRLNDSAIELLFTVSGGIIQGFSMTEANLEHAAVKTDVDYHGFDSTCMPEATTE